jgi:hypothetical protein
MRRSATGSALLLALAAGICCAQPARFRVTGETVQRAVEPFGATIAGIGNSLVAEGAGFEPVVWRTRHLALEDSPGRVVVSQDSLSHYDTLREGFLDGAEARVYRIENGRLRLVREDRVAAGGFHASGWHRAFDERLALAAGSTRFVWRWEPWSRPGATTWFTVRAMDSGGSLSAPAAAFAATRPDKVGAGEPGNALGAFHGSRVGRLMRGLGRTLPAPRNLRGRVGEDGALTLQWDPVPGAAGYLVYRSDIEPSLHKGFYLQLEKAEPVRAGDMVMLSKKLYSASRNRFLSNRVWGAENEYRRILPGLVGFFPDEAPGKSWRLEPHGRDTPVAEPGETYLRVELAAGATEALLAYNHGGTAQDWYDVLEPRPYRVEVWLRQEGAGRVRFRLGGFYAQKIEPLELRAGRDWKKFAFTFTPPTVQPGADPGAMLLELTGPGVFSVDNFRVYRADAGYLDLLPEDYAALAASRFSSLRTHGLVKTGVRTYDVEQLTNPGGVASGAHKLNTLPQLLAVMRKARVQPWLQVELHLGPREWLALAEYLAAPYDPARDTPQAKPWAHKRHAQGQVRPWIDEFERIDLELSNETWNRLFQPWTFEPMSDAVSGKRYSAGQVYGLYQEYVVATLKESPHWPALEKKLRFVLGGWAGQSYGADAAASSPSSHLLTIGAYIGGWDEGEPPARLDAAGLAEILAHLAQAGIPVAERHAREAAAVGVYEAGPGYALNGLNNARVSEAQHRAQEQAMKSLAAGTATLDAFLARAYRGYRVQSFFTFGRGELWTSHAKWHLGGQAYPSWKALALFNAEAAGDMLRTDTLSTPTAALKAFERRQAVAQAPLVAVYATRRQGRVCVFALSRKVEGDTPVTVELPFARARSVTLYAMRGDPAANNLMADNVSVEKTQLGEGAKELNLILPPAATLLYVFEGV